MAATLFLDTDWWTPALLAALSVGGLLIGFLLLYIRFARIEELLSRLQEIQSLSEEIRELKQTMSALSFAQLEEHLEGIRQLNQQMDASLAGIRQGVAEMSAQVRTGKVHSIQDVVERKFFNQGYDSVVILSDLAAELEEPVKVQLEAVRGGITYKGFVVVQNHNVVEASLKPSYEAFP